jgi:hypothetical protein
MRKKSTVKLVLLVALVLATAGLFVACGDSETADVGDPRGVRGSGHQWARSDFGEPETAVRPSVCVRDLQATKCYG